MAKFAGAFRKRRKHRVAVRNGFVSRQVQSSSEVFRGMNGLFFHHEILTCGVARPRIPRTLSRFPFASINLCHTTLSVRTVFGKHGPDNSMKSAGRTLRIMESGEL